MPQLLPLQRELIHVTASLSLYGFASGLAGVFIPLIILQTGAPLSYVAGFYVLYAFVKLAINYPVILGIARYGAHVGLTVGYAASAVQMLSVLIYARTHHLAALAIGAAALAVAYACIWSSQHLHISRLANSATRSSSMATMEIIKQLVSVAAPLAGGLIGAFFGPSWILVAAFVIALGAVVSLRGVAALDAPLNPNAPAPRISYSLRGAPLRDAAANFCFNIDNAISNLLWPVYLAVVVSSYRGIGAISALAAVAAMATAWLAGHRGDRGHDRSVLQHGVAISSAVNLLRLAAAGPLSIALVGAGHRAALAYFGNAWASTYYAHAKDGGVAYVMSMEIACDLAYAGLWLLMLGLSLSVPSQVLFGVGFGIAAVAAWGCLMIRPQQSSEAT